MHLLRDLGKDLLSDMHTDLGIMINRTGIKSPLKSILRSIPAYNQVTLYDIEQGFAKSLLLLISLVIGLRVLYALTDPTGEYAIIQYIKGSTRVFSGIELIDNAFVFSGTAVVAFLISANDYLPLFIALFLIELLGGVVIFRIIQNLEHDKIPKEN